MIILLSNSPYKMPRKSSPCSCFYCGDEFKWTDWSKQQKELHNEYGWRYVTQRITDIDYNLSPHIGGDGMCRPCFKSHLQQDIEPH